MEQCNCSRNLSVAAVSVAVIDLKKHKPFGVGVVENL
jgi:hypothetical protein